MHSVSPARQTNPTDSVEYCRLLQRCDNIAAGTAWLVTKRVSSFLPLNSSRYRALANCDITADTIRPVSPRALACSARSVTSLLKVGSVSLPPAIHTVQSHRDCNPANDGLISYGDTSTAVALIVHTDGQNGSVVPCTSVLKYYCCCTCSVNVKNRSSRKFLV